MLDVIFGYVVMMIVRGVGKLSVKSVMIVVAEIVWMIVFIVVISVIYVKTKDTLPIKTVFVQNVKCASEHFFEPCTECNRIICFECGTKKCNTEIVHECLSCTKKVHIKLLDGLSKIECGRAGVHSAQDAVHKIQQLIGKEVIS